MLLRLRDPAHSLHLHNSDVDHLRRIPAAHCRHILRFGYIQIDLVPHIHHLVRILPHVAALLLNSSVPDIDTDYIHSV